MNLDVRHDGAVAIIAPSGRLTATTAPQLKAGIEKIISGGGSRIVVDMSALQFIDSTGLGALIGGLKASRTAGGDLRIAAATDTVRRVLKLTNLDRVLKEYPSPAEAFAGE